MSAPGGAMTAIRRMLEERQYDAVLALTAQALAAGAAPAAVHLARGSAFFERGDLPDAAESLRCAVDADPASAESHLLLARVLRDLGSLAAARRRARTALSLAPQSQAGRALLFDILTREFRAGLRADCVAAERGPTGAAVVAEGPKISVIICSVDAVKYGRVLANYTRLLAGRSHEVIRIEDASSLCEGYNRGAARATGEILVFSHDDIEILSGDFAACLVDHLEHFDMVGVAGTTRVVDATWGLAGWPHCHGQIVHTDRGTGTCAVAQFQVAGRVVEQVQALDGLFFAARRRVLDVTRFDAETFDGFHLYDLDFTYRAFLDGFRLAICNDIVIAHDSRGKFDERYTHYALRFVAKHRGRLSLERGTVESLPEAIFDSTADARDFCGLWLACVTDAPIAEGSTAQSEPSGFAWQAPAAAAAAADRNGRRQANRNVVDYCRVAAPSTVWVCGVDTAGLAVAVRQRHPASALLTLAPSGEGFGAALSIPDTPADLIVLETILERLPNPWDFLNSLRSAASPDAELILSTVNPRNLVRLDEQVQGVHDFDERGRWDIRRLRCLSLTGWRRALGQTGWRVTRVGAVIEPGLKSVFERRDPRQTGLEASFGRVRISGLTRAELNELCAQTFLIAATPATTLPC